MSFVPAAKKVPTYDPINDFTPITLVGVTPNLLITSASSPVKSLKEVVALCKAQPGKVSFGSAGPGTIQHFAIEKFKLLAGVEDAEVVRYTRTPGWRDFLGFLAESGGGAGGGAMQAQIRQRLGLIGACRHNRRMGRRIQIDLRRGKSETLAHRGGNLALQIHHTGIIKHRIAALQVGLDPRQTQFLQQGTEFRHRQPVGPCHIHAPEQKHLDHEKFPSAATWACPGISAKSARPQPTSVRPRRSFLRFA